MTFTYNPAGQIVTRAMSNPTYAYAAPPATTNYLLDRLNRIKSANSVNFTYDANSNLTNDGVRSYSYDNANRLTGGGSPAGTLSYDALGRLDILTGTYGGRYVYTGAEAVALANPSTNAIENHFVRGPGVDEIVANYPTATMSNPLFWLLDERNSLMALTDVGGATPYKNGYDDYGQPRPGNLGRFQYTGQLLMPDFGAYHYKARGYSPGTGRFLQTDPVGYAAGMNLYGYVGGDPVNRTDSSGLQADNVDDIVVTGRRRCREGATCIDYDRAKFYLDNQTFEWVHVYEIDTQICRVSAPTGVIQDAGRRIGYPGQDPNRPTTDPSTTRMVYIPFTRLPGGVVNVQYSPDWLTNVNTTVPFQHSLQGSITMSRYDVNGTWRINIYGQGANTLWWQQGANALGGPPIFRAVVSQTRAYLRNSYSGC